MARSARASTGVSRTFIAFGNPGRYHPPTECTTDSKSAHSTRVKTRLSVDRASLDAVEHWIGPGDYPVNILGGYRWPDTKPLEPKRLATILNAEIGNNWLDLPPATEGAAP